MSAVLAYKFDQVRGKVYKFKEFNEVKRRIAKPKSSQQSQREPIASGWCVILSLLSDFLRINKIFEFTISSVKITV